MSSAIHRDSAALRALQLAPRLVASRRQRRLGRAGAGDVGRCACLPVLRRSAPSSRGLPTWTRIPLVFSDRRIDAIVAALAALRPSFGAVSIEDVAAPGCFELERRCAARSTVRSCITTSMAPRLLRWPPCAHAGAAHRPRFRRQARGDLDSAGAAGIATARLLATAGLPDLTLVDTHAIVSAQRRNLTAAKREATTYTNLRGLTGGLEDALRDADALVGLSRATVAGTLLAGMCPSRSSCRWPTPFPRSHRRLPARWAPFTPPA